MTAALKQALEALREANDHWCCTDGQQDRLTAAITAAESELSREQPARVGLTDGQVLGLLGKAIDFPMACERAAFTKGIRAAERAHNIPAAQEGK